jgi:hypothetical protein
MKSSWRRRGSGIGGTPIRSTLLLSSLMNASFQASKKQSSQIGVFCTGNTMHFIAFDIRFTLRMGKPITQVKKPFQTKSQLLFFFERREVFPYVFIIASSAVALLTHVRCVIQRVALISLFRLQSSLSFGMYLSHRYLSLQQSQYTAVGIPLVQ